MAEMKAEITISVEGLDTAQVSVLLFDYFIHKNLLTEYKSQRRTMHETGKCTKNNCLTDREEGDFLKEPNLQTACDFCAKRHTLFLLIKHTAAKCRGIMTKIQRHVVRMPAFKQLTDQIKEHNENVFE